MVNYKYKLSDIQFIDKIPTHWELVKMKRVLNEPLKYGANESAELDDQELPRYIRITDFGNDGKLKDDTFKSLPIEQAKDYMLTEGDVLFARSGATVGKTFQFKNYVGVACYAGYLIKATPRKWQLDSDFLYYYTKSIAYEEWKNIIFTQATIQNIGADKYQYLDITLPPLPEQRAIANYLDKACQRIDSIIEIKQKQLERIEGYFKTRIIETTTKGLRKEVCLKPVKSVWIKGVPEHWKVKKIKRLSKVFRGKFTHRPRNDERLYDGEYPFIQTGSVTNAKKYINEYHQTLNEWGKSVSELFPAGTLTMTIAANIADVAILNFDACFPDSIVGFKPQHFIEIEYLYYLFIALRQDFLGTAIITTQMNLNVVRIGDIEGFAPPMEEQLEIVEYLNNLSTKTENLKEKLNSQISTLQTYRKSLIHECVTGKKQVWEGEIEKVN